MSVLDLGAAPGGWSLYASEQLSHLGTVVAVDLLSLDKTLQSTHSDISSRIKANLQSNFHYVQGDFTNSDVLTMQQIVQQMAKKKVGVRMLGLI